MLWTVISFLLALWVLGLVTGTTLDGFIHLLLMIAAIVLVIQLVTGRRAL
ncbi:MAG: lmo0937 family membrane protein [Coriobacteriia bacterium]